MDGIGFEKDSLPRKILRPLVSIKSAALPTYVETHRNRPRRGGGGATRGEALSFGHRSDLYSGSRTVCSQGSGLSCCRTGGLPCIQAADVPCCQAAGLH